MEASNLTNVCAEEHAAKDADGDKVTYCDRFFETSPFIRLPKDKHAKANQSSTLYGAIDPLLLRFIDRKGKSYQLVDANGEPLSVVPFGTSKPPPVAGLTATLRLPSYRAFFTLYEVTGILRKQSGGTQDLEIHDGRPVVVVRGGVIDKLGMGSWEGTVSQRNADGAWNPDVRVPIRVTFGTPTLDGKLPAWGVPATAHGEAPSGDKGLADGKHFLIPGVVENLKAAVRGSEGTCLPSLSGMGNENPFYGATDSSVKLYRYVGMHAAGVESIVLTYPTHDGSPLTGLAVDGMNFDGVTSEFLPADWISASPNPTLTITPHTGTAAAVTHVLMMHRVAGGGGICD